MNLERFLKRSSGTSMLRHFSRFLTMSLKRAIGSSLRTEWMLWGQNWMALRSKLRILSQTAATTPFSDSRAQRILPQAIPSFPRRVVDPRNAPMGNKRYSASNAVRIHSASVMGKERHSARNVGGPVFARITNSGTAAKSVKELPFAPTEKTRSSVETVEGHRYAPIKKEGYCARSVMDPRYAPTGDKSHDARSVVDPRYALMRN